MTRTLIESLADFAANTPAQSLPPEVVEESKRIILDSIGCALAAHQEPKGEIGVNFATTLGGQSEEASIIGSTQRSSVFGAAFANGELISALDFDCVVPPGHVTPYVTPIALGMGEARRQSGLEVIRALAVGHEIPYRLGKAMDYLRDTENGKVRPPTVFGYASTIFGATAASLMLRGQNAGVMADGLGIAAAISPVNSQVAWFQHAPSSTIKYLLAGHLTQSALTASYMAELGHRGDLRILDDAEFGYPRFIGTRRWQPDGIAKNLGQHWGFVRESAFKPFPHCRILHSLLESLGRLVEEHDIRPAEIEEIKVWVEGMVEQPVWLNTRIEHVQDAQFSIAHGIAIGAHRVPVGKEWQRPELVFSDSVMGLMDKVKIEVHPDYVSLRDKHPGCQPALVELRARGQVLRAEQLYPKGLRSEDPTSYMTTEELVTKFRHNAAGVIEGAALDRVIDMALNLEQLDDIGRLMRALAPAPIRAAA